MLRNADHRGDNLENPGRPRHWAVRAAFCASPPCAPDGHQYRVGCERPRQLPGHAAPPHGRLGVAHTPRGGVRVGRARGLTAVQPTRHHVDQSVRSITSSCKALRYASPSRSARLARRSRARDLDDDASERRSGTYVMAARCRGSERPAFATHHAEQVDAVHPKLAAHVRYEVVPFGVLLL